MMFLNYSLTFFINKLLLRFILCWFKVESLLFYWLDVLETNKNILQCAESFGIYTQIGMIGTKQV